MFEPHRARESFLEAAPHAGRESIELAEALGAHAPSLFPLVVADPTVLEDVRARPLDREDEASALRAAFEPIAALPDGPELFRALRRARHRAMVRIALREVLGLADVDRTAAELATLASVALDAALRACRRGAEARLGVPRDEHGAPVPMVVLGMGKLGGGELNLGSDVDLIFFYGTDDAQLFSPEGEDAPSADASVHELFTRVVRRVSRALGEVTEDGFVFRVDLRLRPEGSQGALANSLASAERYYESFGRGWERAALLRARPVAGDRAFGRRVEDALRPFVWRRSVDPSIAVDMHELVLRARRQLAASEHDVKLGRGGIREAEFFVQTLQLVWGGRHPQLQVPGTIEALRRLKALGYVTHRDADALEAAWALLRRVEHRIHMVAGYQTHSLPADRGELARSLGFADAAAFDEALGRERRLVARLFDSLVDEGSRGVNAHASFVEQLASAMLALSTRTPSTRGHDGASPTDRAPAAHEGDDVTERLVERLLELIPVRDPDEAIAHLLRLARRAESPFGALGRARRPGFAASLLSEVSQAPDPLLALRYLADLFLRGGSGYEGMLADEPRLARRVVGLCGSSPTLAELLVGHPESLGEVFRGSSAPTDDEVEVAHADLDTFLRGEVPSTEAEGAPREDDAPTLDPERFVSELRRVRREQLLRIGLASVGGELRARDAQRRLTSLADAQVRRAFSFALRECEARWGRPSSAMAVVAMGKLGGAELGFTSDLDLVFLYGADGETDGGRAHVDFFSRVAQRTMRLLTQLDPEGPGYEVDTRLRPSGSHGLLVVSRAAFEAYHESSHAEAWERQALVRARVVVASDAAFEAEVGALFEQTAYAHGAPDPERLAALRGRMQRELAGERAHRYHPKLGFGGLLDVELATQWLQMSHGEDPTVHRRHTLDALDALAAGRYLAPATAEVLRDGYRFFRSVEQANALLEGSGDGTLVFGGPRAAAISRALGVRERDGVDASEVLRRAWERRAHEVRAVFERLLAPVDAPPGWSEVAS
ncbi:MAG: bifunctional [glutamate--ammonia ligase]-adenylyl-L-tyrosine phosphorylase/[glutamate--ammonia-ligase] adenylyltransferase [Myxococcales bacterium]|nr:bifunctional [glutamate--ammonia ligase]-adenylyl-L-tyrosine phosphorylase/[glutamate--ammonia-ligase] adenylyltransferase [Myxococcales bacterium]